MWLFSFVFMSFSVFTTKSSRNLECPAAPDSNRNAIESSYTKTFVYAHLIMNVVGK